ncbi:hypothetical protein AMJ80_05865 [bacterium SM23_31]|nr:MAG: hypothetical protein AMJ80_05865 [bacterium SM23_31]
MYQKFKPVISLIQQINSFAARTAEKMVKNKRCTFGTTVVTTLITTPVRRSLRMIFTPLVHILVKNKCRFSKYLNLLFYHSNSIFTQRSQNTGFSISG